MDRARDLEISTIFQWVVVCQEVRINRKKKVSGIEEPAMASGGDGELPSHKEAAVMVAAVVMEEASSSAAMPEAVESAGGSVAAVEEVGDGEAVRKEDSGLATSSRDTLGSGGVLGSEMEVGGGATGTPHTPTVEDLLAAAERAGDEVVIAGRVIATPVLRATATEPRVGDSGIGASHPVPFTEGDFLDTARP
ncbi:hypothetical protein RHMOL_Rhmol05G0144800 [Rhododendron molle]|uniref:Uncharacterized protein n=1 Tax=Rhododendron molle TaxID=49168 RepID=A0ACC0NP84_RHOML|nr:hypothetical protein RHMOL_Rhmol05G0144800 [Rhododendron molle]